MNASTPLHPENVYGHTKKVRLIQAVIAQHRERNPGRPLGILDIGCGNGFAVSQFLGFAGDDLLGLDFYEPNIAFAREHFAKENMRFECIDARTLQAEGKTYDIIVLADILEHLDQPEQMLALCSALLADGGRILLTIPNGFGPYEFESYVQKIPVLGPALVRFYDLAAAVMDRFVFKDRWTEMARRGPDNLPYNFGSPHVQWYTLSRMKRLLAQAGLKIDDHRNLSVFSGPFSNYVFGPFATACRVNTEVADHLPHWMTSAWWMQVSKAPSGSRLD